MNTALNRFKQRTGLNKLEADLMEMRITTIFLLILLYPYNLHVFRRNADIAEADKKPCFGMLRRADESRKVAWKRPGVGI